MKAHICEQLLFTSSAGTHGLWGRRWKLERVNDKMTKTPYPLMDHMGGFVCFSPVIRSQILAGIFQGMSSLFLFDFLLSSSRVTCTSVCLLQVTSGKHASMQTCNSKKGQVQTVPSSSLMFLGLVSNASDTCRLAV